MLNSRIIAGLLPLVRVSGIAELVQLDENLRTACRISLPLAHEKKFYALCREAGFHVSRSPFPVKGNTQVCTFEKEKKSSWATYLYYVAKEESGAFLASVSEGSNYELHGKLFGYPGCCIAFFKNNSGKLAEDLTLSIRNAGPYNHLLNRCAKAIGQSLISHFPCSWNCKSSVELAQKTVDALARLDPLMVSKLDEILLSNVFYSEEQVIFCRKLREGNSMVAFAQYGPLPDFTALKSENGTVFVLRDKKWEEAPGWQYLPFAGSNSDNLVYLH